MQERDRRLVSLFGARGLSSLLLVLVPVFAGLPGSERLFTITSFVVLLSIVLHGGGIGLFIRRHGAAPAPTEAPAAIAPPVPVRQAEEQVPTRISIDEMRDLLARGEPIVVVDSRANRNYEPETITAAGAVRVNPDDPIRDATALRLSQRATLVVYCA